MAETAETFWTKLKEQFVYYRKQTAILAILIVVLLVIVGRQLLEEAPQTTAAADKPTPSVVNTSSKDPDMADDKPGEIQLRVSEIRHELKRNPFVCSWSDRIEPDATVPALQDRDGDGVTDDQDNCPDAPNEDQVDRDGDGTGDACEHGSAHDERAQRLNQIRFYGTEMQGRNASAMINDTFHYEGDTIKGFVILRINVRKNTVELRDELGTVILDSAWSARHRK